MAFSGLRKQINKANQVNMITIIICINNEFYNILKLNTMIYFIIVTISTN